MLAAAARALARRVPHAARGAAAGAPGGGGGGAAAARRGAGALAAGAGALPRSLLFLGPPGVGKGTYAARVAAHLGVPHVAAGDLVRGEIERGTPLGMQVKERIAAGRLLDDETVFSLVAARLGGDDVSAAGGAVLDGFPRSVTQVQMLERVSRAALVVNLGMRPEALVTKLLGRAACARCGASYNTAEVDLPAETGKSAVFLRSLPMPEGGCRVCGCKDLTRRADDAEAVVHRRLAEHDAQCAGVANHYRNKAAAGGPNAPKVVDFEITKGIPETLPLLLKEVEATDTGVGQSAGADAAAAAVEAARAAEKKTAAETRAAEKQQLQQPQPQDQVYGHMYSSFPCKGCGEPLSKVFSKQAYYHGVVWVQCANCSTRQVIADNLGWFSDRPINLNDMAGPGSRILPTGNVEISSEEQARIAETVSEFMRRKQVPSKRKQVPSK